MNQISTFLRLEANRKLTLGEVYELQDMIIKAVLERNKNNTPALRFEIAVSSLEYKTALFFKKV